jgi:hypothetical protein
MVFGFTNAVAGPSAKATAKIADLSVIQVSGNDTGGEGSTPWNRILTQTIKIPQGKDLFIDVSLECGLTTNTKVMSKRLAKAAAFAEAVVEVRVLVGDVAVEVNENDAVEVNENGDTDITFARRSQTLIAEFAGSLENADNESCLIFTPDGSGGGSVTIDWECVQPETLQLILDTMQANSFNFIAPDLEAGEYNIAVEAKLSYIADNQSDQNILDGAAAEGEAFAEAYLGNGSVTIETVRMIKDEDVVDIE